MESYYLNKNKYNIKQLYREKKFIIQNDNAN